MTTAPQVIAQRRCKTGENPLWDPDNESVYWTDIPAGRIYSYDLRNRRTITLYEGPPVGGFTLQEDGSFLLFRVTDIARRFPDGRVETIIPFPEDGADRFNDVIADPEGRVFAGRMAESDDNGALFRIDQDGSIHRLFGGCACPNGMAFSPDNSLFYFTCSTSRKIYRFRYDVSNGELTDREILFSANENEGLPDGLTVDQEGNLWSARFNGGKIVKHAPDGRILGELLLFAKQATSVTFGGETLDTLFITSAGGSEEDDSDAGALFSWKAPVAGRLEFRSRILLNSTA